MTPRQRLRKLGLSGLIAALACSLSAYAGSSGVMAAEEIRPRSCSGANAWFRSGPGTGTAPRNILQHQRCSGKT